MKPQLNWHIGHINLYSKDQPRLVRFYRDVMGLLPLDDTKGDKRWYGFGTEGTIFALEPISNRNSYTWKYNENNPVLLQFLARDEEELEAIHQHLERQGVQLLRRSEQRSYGKITNFLDPDGNVLEILLPTSDNFVPQ